MEKETYIAFAYSKDLHLELLSTFRPFNEPSFSASCIDYFHFIRKLYLFVTPKEHGRLVSGST